MDLVKKQITTKVFPQGVCLTLKPNPTCSPLPLKGDTLCFLATLAHNAIFSKEISTCFSRKAESTCPQPLAP